MSAPDYAPRTRAGAIAFQFIADRFVGSTIVANGDADEIGVFIMLLCKDWMEDGFEHDPRRLARYCHVSPDKFKKVWMRVRTHFVELPNGRFTDPYLENQRELRRLWHEKSSQGGKTSAANKKEKGGSTTVGSVVEPPLQPPLEKTSTKAQPTGEPNAQPNGKPPYSVLPAPHSETPLTPSYDGEAAAASPPPFDLTPRFGEVAKRLANEYHQDAFAKVVLDFPLEQRASVVENIRAYLDGDTGYKKRDRLEIALGLIDYHVKSGNLPRTIKALRSFIDRAEVLYTQARAEAAAELEALRK